MKNIIMKSLSALGAIIVVVVAIVGGSILGIAQATTYLEQHPPVVNVQTWTGNVVVSNGNSPVQVDSKKGDVVLGAFQTISPNITDLTDISNLNNVENLYLWGKGEVAGGFFMDSSSSLGTVSTTIYGAAITGRTSLVTNTFFTDATNTQFCVKSPFGATSTVQLIGIRDTGIATTSVSFIIATSTQSTGLATSTVNFGTSNPNQLLNINLLSSATATNTVFMSGSITDSRSAQNVATVQKLVITPAEFVCGVTGEGNGGNTTGVTNPTNLFSGLVGLLWERFGT